MSRYIVQCPLLGAVVSGSNHHRLKASLALPMTIFMLPTHYTHQKDRLKSKPLGTGAPLDYPGRLVASRSPTNRP
ncbi:hypothetical protein BJX61DRAFT_314336 [Aspergillus egyptiacus]|nr:hypothetical protein BJX61DRAFT_314336 [Aspergillus egyptiacus]